VIAAVEYRQNATIASEVVENEALLWDEHRKELHHLRPTATAVWLRCEQWTPFDEIARELEPTGANSDSDVAQCVRTLVSCGVLEVRASATP
jgi:hypothetical protein